MFLAGSGAHSCKARDDVPSSLSKHTEGSAKTSLTELAEKELLHLLKTMCFRDRKCFPFFSHQLGLYFSLLPKITMNYLLQKEGYTVRLILIHFLVVGC